MRTRHGHDPAAVQGQVYAHVDSTTVAVTVQRSPAVALSKMAAEARVFTEVRPQQTATRVVGAAECRLTLHQLSLPTA